MEAIENMEYTDKIDLSLVVPCYNEQEALPYFYKELKKVIKELPYQYEIVFVNDGSKDDTLSVLREMAREDVHVKYISFSRNFGKLPCMQVFVISKGVLRQLWMRICKTRRSYCQK